METATLAEDGDRIVSQKMGDAMGIFHGIVPLLFYARKGRDSPATYMVFDLPRKWGRNHEK